MNPLGLPKWGNDKPAEQPKQMPKFDYDGDVVTGQSTGNAKPRPVPHISLNDAARRAAALAHHTIELRVLGGESVKMVWEKGRPLGKYLESVGLKGVAIHRAIYDMTNLTAGRLRLYYEPQPGAIIQVQKAAIGVQFHLQTNRGKDVESLALKMGTQGLPRGAEPPKFVEYNMRYRSPAPMPKEPDSDDQGGVPQV